MGGSCGCPWVAGRRGQVGTVRVSSVWSAASGLLLWSPASLPQVGFT